MWRYTTRLDCGVSFGEDILGWLAALRPGLAQRRAAGAGRLMRGAARRCSPQARQSCPTLWRLLDWCCLSPTPPLPASWVRRGCAAGCHVLAWLLAARTRAVVDLIECTAKPTSAVSPRNSVKKIRALPDARPHNDPTRKRAAMQGRVRLARLPPAPP
eukprot:COSAG01_NODE_3192_length_6435_cov_14.950284_3_plen_158_part_00